MKNDYIIDFMASYQNIGKIFFYFEFCQGGNLYNIIQK